MINFDSLRSDIVKVYNAYVDSARRYESRFNPIGGKKRTGRYVTEEYTEVRTYANGRKRTYHGRRCVPEYVTITPEMFEAEIQRQVTSTCIHFRTDGTDAVSCIRMNDWLNPTNEEIERLVNHFPSLYRDHLIGFEVKLYPYYGANSGEYFSSAEPIFEGEFMNMWTESYESYCSAKAAWCEKYGCD